MNIARFKTAAVLGIPALAVGFLAFAGPPQRADWKGQFLLEAGVRVVVNPAESIYGQIKPDLEEELRIGKEGDDKTQFYRVMDVGVDPSGNIYVVDARNFRVQVFDPSGAFLRTIGRQGQGPGEFELPSAVRFGGQAGYTHVLDRFRRVSLFDAQGIYLGPVATEDKQVDVFSREGRFLFQTALPPNTRTIRGDLIYTYYVDEDQGLEYVQRFRIKNYAGLPKD